MRSSILTQIVENLGNVMRFIPERELLVSRIIGEMMRVLQKTVREYSEGPLGEIAGSGQVGTLKEVADHPDTERLLKEFADAAMNFMEHYRQVEDYVQKSKSGVVLPN